MQRFAGHFEEATEGYDDEPGAITFFFT